MSFNRLDFYRALPVGKALIDTCDYLIKNSKLTPKDGVLLLGVYDSSIGTYLNQVNRVSKLECYIKHYKIMQENPLEDEDTNQFADIEIKNATIFSYFDTKQVSNAKIICIENNTTFEPLIPEKINCESFNTWIHDKIIEYSMKLNVEEFKTLLEQNILLQTENNNVSPIIIGNFNKLNKIVNNKMDINLYNVAYAAPGEDVLFYRRVTMLGKLDLDDSWFTDDNSPEDDEDLNNSFTE